MKRDDDTREGVVLLTGDGKVSIEPVEVLDSSKKIEIFPQAANRCQLISRLLEGADSDVVPLPLCMSAVQAWNEFVELLSTRQLTQRDHYVLREVPEEKILAGLLVRVWLSCWACC